MAHLALSQNIDDDHRQSSHIPKLLV